MKRVNPINLIATLAVVILSFSVFAQGQTPNGSVNYSITPKLPKPPKPEPFTVTTIPLSNEVSEATLVNYLPDGEHLIMDVTATEPDCPKKATRVRTCLLPKTI